MPSTLNTKILSYNPEYSIELSEAYSTQPTSSGTLVNGQLSYANIGSWTLDGPTPVGFTSGGPQNGSGYWEFYNLSRYRHFATDFGSVFTDGGTPDYVVGVWFRLPVLPIGGSLAGRNIGFLLPRSDTLGYSAVVSATGYTGNGGGSRLNVNGNSAGGAQFVPVGPVLEANKWYYFVVARNGLGTDSFKVYLNGELVLTQTVSGTGPFSALGIAGNAPSDNSVIQLSNYHVGNNANFTPAAILDIYNTAYPASTNNEENPASMQASSLIVDSLVGTSTTVTSDVLTSSAQQVDPLVVSASSNLAVNFATASALIINPTITIVNNDNTEIWTSVTVDALMVNPSSVIAQRNTSIQADPMTASEDIQNHVTITGSGTLYAPQPITAGITIVNPAFAGSGDRPVAVSAMITSSAVFVSPVIVVPMSYDTLVLQKNPIFFINDGNESNPPPVNKGSKNFGLIDLQSQWEVLPSGSPMAAHGEGTSWYTDAGDTNSEMYIFNADAAQAIKDMHLGSGFTYEFWWKPLDFNYDTQSNNTNFWIYDGYFYMWLTGAEPGTKTQTFLNAEINNDTPDYVFTKNYPSQWINPDYPATTYPAGNYSPMVPIPTKNVWHHMVITGSYASDTITMKWYIDGSLMHTDTKAFTKNTTAINTKVGGVRTNTRHGASSHYFDQFAIYDRPLTASEVIDHYSYILTNDGSRVVGTLPLTAQAQFSDPSVLSVINLNYPETPSTASGEIVQPTVLATISITLSATILTASANSVVPTVDTVYSINLSATPLTVNANMPGGFTPNEAFAVYVNALSPAPYRYHNLDNQNEWTGNVLNGNSNGGTDSVYSLPTHQLGDGNHAVLTGIINNYSVLSELDYNDFNYPKSLVVYESEYNDDWGTTFNNTGDGWTLSFCVRAHRGHPVGQGMVVLASARSYTTTDNFLIYHHNNKLNVEIKHNGTIQSYESPSNVNLFNFVKHQITMTLHRNSTNNNRLDVYVDGVSVLTENINNHAPIFLQSNTVQGPNTTNWAKVALGGLLSNKTEYNFFANNNEDPQYSKLYFDEFIWLKWDLNATQALGLFNALPLQTDIDYLSTAKTASALLVEPTLSLGTTKTATALQAINGIVVDPVLYYDKEISVGVIGTATAEMKDATVSFITHININATPLTSLATIMPAVFKFSVSGGPMIATVKAVNSPLYFDPYNLLIMTQSYNTSSSMTTFGGRWGIGDH